MLISELFLEIPFLYTVQIEQEIMKKEEKSIINFLTHTVQMELVIELDVS
jgi:hypothetical protein